MLPMNSSAAKGESSMASDLLITTTTAIEGRPVKEYLGVVTGEAILGANIFRDIFASIRDIVGGRSGAYEKELRKAREIAFQEMAEAARQLGANAVIGVDIDYETIDMGGSNMLMVTVSGTAVRI
jgi:uncharacterized protein YbjQ (UPF0145 family)